MNASYKIVLLGVFVLFAAVVGYYVLDSGSDKPAETLADNTAKPNGEDEAPDQTNPPPRNPATNERPGLERRPIDPGNEITIDTPDETPGIDREGPGTEDTPGIGDTPDVDDGPGGVIRHSPEPGVIETERPGPGTEEPGEIDRPGPGVTETIDTETPGTDRPGPGTPGSDPDEDPGVDEPGPGTETETETERPTPRAPGNTPRTYIVKAGDTLSSIALKVYGEESAWFKIAQANPSVDPKRLQVDQVLVLPNLADTEDEPEEATPPAPGQDQTYTVQPGDNLSKIAKKFYGDTEAWDLIYNRNRDKIGPRPDRLKVGMKLIIPQPYSGAE